MYDLTSEAPDDSTPEYSTPGTPNLEPPLPDKYKYPDPVRGDFDDPAGQGFYFEGHPPTRCKEPHPGISHEDGADRSQAPPNFFADLIDKEQIPVDFR